jgi:hypothetical protein
VAAGQWRHSRVAAKTAGGGSVAPPNPLGGDGSTLFHLFAGGGEVASDGFCGAATNLLRCRDGPYGPILGLTGSSWDWFAFTRGFYERYLQGHILHVGEG